jgi:hypothetical protein
MGHASCLKLSPPSAYCEATRAPEDVDAACSLPPGDWHCEWCAPSAAHPKANIPGATDYIGAIFTTPVLRPTEDGKGVECSPPSADRGDGYIWVVRSMYRAGGEWRYDVETLPIRNHESKGIHRLSVTVEETINHAKAGYICWNPPEAWQHIVVKKKRRAADLAGLSASSSAGSSEMLFGRMRGVEADEGEKELVTTDNATMTSINKARQEAEYARIKAVEAKEFAAMMESKARSSGATNFDQGAAATSAVRAHEAELASTEASEYYKTILCSAQEAVDNEDTAVMAKQAERERVFALYGR